MRARDITGKSRLGKNLPAPSGAISLKKSESESGPEKSQSFMHDYRHRQSIVKDATNLIVIQ
jgi:hypothetical protein